MRSAELKSVLLEELALSPQAASSNAAAAAVRHPNPRTDMVFVLSFAPPRVVAQKAVLVTARRALTPHDAKLSRA